MAASDETLPMVPKTLRELAAAVEEPPSRYVRLEQERQAGLVAADEMPEPIPRIDLSRLMDADEADKLRAALQTWGLFLATNHGIEDSLMDAMMSAAREVFQQPLEEKQKYSNSVEGKPFQIEGYGNDNVEAQDQILDWKDRLHLRLEPEDERNLDKWPSHPKLFRDVLREYTLGTTRIRDLILRSIAKLLDLDEHYFIKKLSQRSPAFARFNYYPPCPRPDLVLGFKAHSDGGLITILFVDKAVGGLQVHKDGNWYNIPLKPYTLVINIGDCMEIMNNGIFTSPLHRVVTNVVQDRLSLAVFYGVDGETVLEPAPGLLDDKRPPRYQKIQVNDFIVGLSEHFYQGKRFIEALKI